MKETKLDIYSPSRNTAFEKELERLKKANISQRNKDLITDFHNYLFSKDSGELRVAKLSSQLRNICRWLKNALEINKDLDKLNKKDIMNLVSFINRGLKEKAEATRSDYKRALKQFFRWFKDEDERVYSRKKEQRIEAKKLYTYLEKEVSSNYKQRQADPNTIINDDEISIIIDKGAKTPKEKAFLSLLHETGCRASEFLNLKIGNIKMKESYIEINVPDGKTGKRVIYATKSIPYIIRYLDIHPYKNNNNSYLWLSDARFNLNQPLQHRGGQKLINRCFERAGIAKRHNWHWFRHSRATILAPKLTEVMLCKYMGWTTGKMIKTYVHLCNNQLEDTFLALHGIKSKKDETEKPIKCICGALNNPKERYCFKCYKPLKVETVIQDQELINSEVNKTIKFFMEMAKNPELMKKFEEFKKNIN